MTHLGRVAATLVCNAVPPRPWNAPETWPSWTLLLPHALAVTTGPHAHADPDQVPWLLGRAATYLQTRGEPRQALPLFEHALTLNQRRLGDDHPDTLISADNLAVDLSELGKHERAHALKEDTLARKRRVLGDDHPFTLTSAANLASALRALGRHDEAEAIEAEMGERRLPG